MKIEKIILLIVIALSFTFNSCEEEDHQINSATIEITSPSEDFEFDFGETVQIQATAEAEENLHGYKIEISNNTGMLLYETEEHAHSTALTINEEWINDIQEPGIVVISITVALDHDGNTETASVKIVCSAE